MSMPPVARPGHVVTIPLVPALVPARIARSRTAVAEIVVLRFPCAHQGRSPRPGGFVAGGDGVGVPRQPFNKNSQK